MYQRESQQCQQQYEVYQAKVQKQKNERTKLKSIIEKDTAELLEVRDGCEADLSQAKKAKD